MNGHRKIVIIFGAENFEYVWERMIVKVFGVKNKRDFFPRTYWRHLPKNNTSLHENDTLEPDTIMIMDVRGKRRAFVLDAKYYRFGVMGSPLHLPSSSSLNKQITYGEYVSTLLEFNDTETSKSFSGLNVCSIVNAKRRLASFLFDDVA
jgi:hypothetical protein